jgi:hypothetical protein
MKMFANCIRNYMYLDCSSGPSPVCYFTANFMFSTAHAHNVPMYVGLMLQLVQPAIGIIVYCFKAHTYSHTITVFIMFEVHSF